MVAEPNTAYGCAKLWATVYGEHLRREEGVPITTLRLFSVYGPFEAKSRLVPAVTLSLLADNLPTLSSPKTARDFVYVGDVVAAIMLASDVNKPGVYNIGGGTNVTLQEIVDCIAAEVGSSLELVWGSDASRSFDTARWVADTTKTEEVLGWKSTTPLVDGIVKTVQWLKEHDGLYAK